MTKRMHEAIASAEHLLVEVTTLKNRHLHSSESWAMASNDFSHVEERLLELKRLTIGPSGQAILDSALVWMPRLKDLSKNKTSLLATSDQATLIQKIEMGMQQLIENESSLLNQQYNAWEERIRRYDVLIVLTQSMIGLMCALSFLTIWLQQKENKKLMLGLKQRVASRTFDLETSNEELKSSMEEVHALNQDIEARNQRLGELLEEMQFLYDYSPSGYHTIGPDGTLLKMNKTELEWLGYTEEEVIGQMKATDFLTPESIEKRSLLIEELKRDGGLENLELTFRRKDGSTFPVLMNIITFIDNEGNYLKHRSTIFDITELKRLGNQLEEANKHLMALNQEKNRFLGMVSHDLKNPIGAIVGLVHYLKLKGNLSQEQSDYLGLIETSASKMKALIEKLLDVSKIESLNLVEEASFDLREFLLETLEIFRLQAEKKAVQILFDCPEIAMPLISDKALLGQVVENLLSNALKFSQSGTCTQLLVRKEEGTYQILIKDEGPGFKKEELSKVFGSFQMLSARPTGGESSSGLGLSIAKKIMDALGGKISVESEYGQGTVFTLELPFENSK
jgi:PAS domain S-box-containing protein